MLNLKQLLARRKPFPLVVAIGTAAVLVVGVVVFAWGHVSHHTPPVPTLQVKRSEFLDTIQFRGELKAMKSLTITAPANVGDLQILKIVPDGTRVNANDVVVEMDPSRTRQELAQDQSIMKSAQAGIDQVKAQQRLTEEADATAVMKAKYDVEVAKLEASKAEIVSRIEGEEAKLVLNNAEQALRQAETQLKSDQTVDKATVEGRHNASIKAAYDVQRASHALESMTLKAPAAGTIRLLPVWHNGSEQPYKAGDHLWPGASIAELPDVSSIRISARIDETDRGRIGVGQAATVQLDAIADRQFTGKVEHIGTIATADFSAGWPIPQNFDIEIAQDQSDARLKPGMTVQISVIVNRVPNAIAIPASASFVRSGQTVVYVWTGSKFEERPVQIERHSRDLILVAHGVNVGDLVALKDPSGKE
jgi:multidrug efflux pump subunit AcrA (membrane-fusion protein)